MPSPRTLCLATGPSCKLESLQFLENKSQFNLNGCFICLALSPSTKGSMSGTNTATKLSILPQRNLRWTVVIKVSVALPLVKQDSPINELTILIGDSLKVTRLTVQYKLTQQLEYELDISHINLHGVHTPASELFNVVKGKSAFIVPINKSATRYG